MIRKARSVTVRFSDDEYTRLENILALGNRGWWKVSEHIRQAVKEYCVRRELEQKEIPEPPRKADAGVRKTTRPRSRPKRS